jgi:outer membrane lipoprotein
MSLFVGCSSTPGSLQVEEQENLVSYLDVMGNTTTSQGKVALWGGVIAGVTNQADGSVIEITQLPLRNNTRPRVGEQSEGRFRVFVSGFVDPMVYGVGRSISVLGQVGVMQTAMIGEQEYQFATLHADQVHLWKKRPKTTVTQVDLWPDRYALNWRFWPFSNYHRGYPHRTRVITREYEADDTVAPAPKATEIQQPAAKAPVLDKRPDREYNPQRRIQN